ncbi:ATPase [Hydrogenophilus thermoluteolus]|nr:ATPase [Hydrogenophilus thermoluteolus]
MTMLRSLRWQWFVVAMVVTGVTIAMLAKWLQYEFHDHLEEQQVAELTFQLDAVTANLPELAKSAPLDLPERVAERLADPRWRRPYSGWYWQVERLDRTDAVWSSRSLWDFRLAFPERADWGKGSPVLLRDLAGPDGQKLLALVRVVRWEEEAGQLWRVTVARDQAQLQAIDEEFRQELWTILAGVVVVLLAGGLVQWGLGVRPLRRLERALTAVERGEAHFVAGSYPTELASVVATFNALLRTLREQSETGRRQTGQLAHALKTPLAAILQIARQEAKQPWADEIVAQAELAHAHVRHYLALARAEASRGALGKRCDLAEVLERIVAAMTTIFAEKALQWSCDWPAHCQVVGDARDVTELLGNLLENAARHARARVGVRVVPEVVQGHSGWRIEIEDDGPGFEGAHESSGSMGACASVEAANASDASLLPQAGLGLHVAQTIVRALGGSIAWLGSERYGGARVSLFLPSRFVAESH